MDACARALTRSIAQNSMEPPPLSSSLCLRAPAVYQAYLAKTLRKPDFVRTATRLSSGDRPRVKFESLADVEISLPPRAEQRRIVAKLDSLLAGCSRAHTELEHVRLLVEHYRRRVLATAFCDPVLADESEAVRDPPGRSARSPADGHDNIPPVGASKDLAT